LSSEEDSEAEAPEASMPLEIGTLPQSSPITQYPPFHRQPIMQQLPSSSFISLPPDCFLLLETYLTYTQSWLPICEKLDILKLSYSYPSQGLPLSPDMSDAGSHAEMWSMLALASCFPSGAGGRDHQSTSSTTTLYKQTQALIPNELGQFRLGHVKALLNLALLNLQRANNDAAWLLIGAASRILPTTTEQPGTTESRRAHVTAGCYLLDNLLALSLNRRPYLNLLDVKAAGKIEEDGLEEW
jgi:hypothetical protein